MGAVAVQGLYCFDTCGFYEHGEASFDGFAQIGAKLQHGFPLRSAAGDGRNFGLESALRGLVGHGVNRHESGGGGGS